MGDSQKKTRHNWQPFEEARTLAHSLGLKSRKEWRDWAKSEARPDDIPANPESTYKNKGWVSWGDWLGTGTIAPQKRIYLPFEEARTFVRSLDLKSQTQWRVWSKSDAKPDDIPADPLKIYKAQGWVSWGDWLGTGSIAPSYRIYLPFEEARAFARSLDLKSQTQWRVWSKSDAKPDDIPADPYNAYKDKGWVDWGDWLGTGSIAAQNRTYRPFKEARAFAGTLGLKTEHEWRAWSKSDVKPDDIPANPALVYEDKGWIGWGDWLGTGRIANQNRLYLLFEEARTFAHSLGLKGKDEWVAWSKSDAKPDNIPANPPQIYKHQGWMGWGDWLGTGTIAAQNRIFLSFEKARTFARSLGLKGKDEWVAWSKSNAKPDNIPTNPARTYQGKGWIGWGDWLGIFNKWNQKSILSFLRSLEPVLPYLQPPELYAIMRQNGMIAASGNICNSNAHLIKSIEKLCSSPNPEADFKEIVAEIEEQNAALDNEELSNDEEIAPNVVPTEEETTEELPTLRSFAALKAVDLLVDAGITSDEETLEFLVCNRVSELWQACLNNDPKFDLDRLRAETGGTYFNESATPVINNPLLSLWSE